MSTIPVARLVEYEPYLARKVGMIEKDIPGQANPVRHGNHPNVNRQQCSQEQNDELKSTRKQRL